MRLILFLALAFCMVGLAPVSSVDIDERHCYVGAHNMQDATVVSAQITRNDVQHESRYWHGTLVTINAGQCYQILVSSPDFDPILSFAAPSGHEFNNDDMDSTTRNSYLEGAAPETGTYVIMVSSYELLRTGRFTMRYRIWNR